MQNATENALEAKRLGLVDSSPTAGNMRWLSDQQYHTTLGIHELLWRYAVERFPKERECPILILGYGSLPIAIELSQWTYPITYVAQSEKEKKQVITDCAAQAGNLSQLYTLDWYVNVPKARVCIFTGLLGGLTDRQIYKWMDLVLRRVAYVVCAEHTGRDWKEILEKRYHVTGIRYNHKKYTFLEIRRKYH